MKNRWDDKEAEKFSESDLSLRVYSSRLLGQSADLVLHGGGNTSVKVNQRDIFGQEQALLYVKGSGWDLRTIEAAGFAPCKLEYLQGLAELESLSDSEMMQQLRLSLVDPAAPTPSVEAILHAIIPFKFVDHTHTDAVVGISNTAAGEETLKQIYGDDVLVLPYIMPGFVLAKQIYQLTQGLDWSKIKGVFLMHHGLFTFADDAKSSYSTMIELVERAEAFLQQQGCWQADAQSTYKPQVEDYLCIAKTRKQISTLAGVPMLARWELGEKAVGFSALDNVDDIANRGPVTPDHSIHTKIKGVILNEEPAAEITNYETAYKEYFDRQNPGNLTCLDPAPRYATWKGKGMLSFGQNVKRMMVVGDIAAHTIKAIQWGEALGGWQALPEQDLFDVEYWELEQAKLKKMGASPEFEGKVVLVTGAASGIGKACVEEFAQLGACVIALDIQAEITSLFESPQILGLVCDVTDNAAVDAALFAGIAQFGGLDVVVSNAGRFTPSESVDVMSDENWQASMDLNLSSHMRLMRSALPFLKQGLDPAIVIIASKNVPAPGPGAGAYSAAKAGLTQLARVAAMELGKEGIRVNTLHPNVVIDTAVWDEETLSQRAKHYGLSVEEYKQRNILGVEVLSKDVAKLARNLASHEFSKTTGVQIPVDGGNDRVI